MIVVSHDYWATRLGGDPGAVGRTLTVNGHPFTLVGVAPADFGGIYTGLRPDAWVPLMMQPMLRPRSDLASSSWLWMFGRLRPGTSGAAAQAELASIARATGQRARTDAQSAAPERGAAVAADRPAGR